MIVICTKGQTSISLTNSIPCGHAVALIRRLHQAPSDYMPSCVKNRTLINSYSENFPLSIQQMFGVLNKVFC
jgi:hypothetical protein